MKKRNKVFVLGDLHGNYRGLKFILQKCNFNYELDTLYFVGDICDGTFSNETIECVEELLKIKNFFPCYGNHDLYLKKWIIDDIINPRWISIGGEKTIYNIFKNENYLQLLKSYFSKCKYHHVYNKIVICHGGFNTKKPINNQKEFIFATNRDLYKKVKLCQSQETKLKFYYSKNETIPIDYIIIGHTPTKNNLPDFCGNVINIDTGSGNHGKLTILNLDNFEYLQTELTSKLYKNGLQK